MYFKNNDKRGTIYHIRACKDKILMKTTSGVYDITSYVTSRERGYIFHTGRAYAFVCDSSSITLCLFCQLHTHSEYSILDGLSTLKGIAKKSSGVTAVTDHGNIHCLLKWQNAMNAEGKKAIFGIEVYSESFLTGEKSGQHLILLAKNETGKKNLFYLSSNSYYNFYRKPHVSIEDLTRYHDGLVCTSACLAGEIATTIKNDYESAKKVALFYKGIFGDDYYLEIQRHHIAGEEEIDQKIIKLAHELHIKLICTNDSHYLNEEDKLAHEILLCVNQGKTLAENHFKFDGDGYHYKSDAEMIEDFWDIPEAVANTFEIADKCSLTIETGVYHMPEYPLPDGVTDDSYLIALIKKGYESRFKDTVHYEDPKYKSRLDYETNVILSMGFSSYFLIVWDYVNWAKEHGILVGPGRGSAGGSLVAYVIGITDLNPMEYDLLFERFLNPDRVSMPDIDVDFEDARRGEVIDYVRSKYGQDCVCNIITFGTMLSKTALRDVGKITGKTMEADMLRKKLPDEAGSITEAMQFPEFADYVNSDKDTQIMVQTASDLEGTTRQTGVHACGIVVSDAPLKNYLPTLLVNSGEEKEKILCSQVTMTEVEELGLLKADFLGLKTLSVIGGALESIKQERQNAGLHLLTYYREIPITDPYVYEDLSKGESYAVFQIESAGMRSLVSNLFSDVPVKLRDLESRYDLSGYGEFMTGEGSKREDFQRELDTYGKELFERIIAGVALYRPGPMAYIPDYIAGIKDPHSITYLTPQLEEILKPTYGVTVYQEQVMMIVRQLAGFTMGQADVIRKAMGKKKTEILLEYEPYFIYGSGDKKDTHTGKDLDIKGCVNNGILEDTAKEIWQTMSDFGKYAFNKSHSADYAVITMTCAWLKYYYSSHYMCAVMNTYITNTDKLRSYMGVCQLMNIEILPPDINKSSSLFTVENDSIRFGLKGIASIVQPADLIDRDKKDNGSYLDFADFCDRASCIGIKSKNIEVLIKAGCFDSFGYSRRSLIEYLPTQLVKSKRNNSDRLSGQMNFFTDGILPDNPQPKDVIPRLKEYNTEEIMNTEKESCGMYITTHPLDLYKDQIGVYSITPIALLDTDSRYRSLAIAGVISEVKTVYTKKNKLPMAIIKVEDKTGSISVTVFHETYASSMKNLYENNCVIITGTAEPNEDFGFQMLAECIVSAKAIKKPNQSNLYLHLPDFTYINKIRPLLDSHPGSSPVSYQIGNRLYKLPCMVEIIPDLISNISVIIGTNNILVK